MLQGSSTKVSFIISFIKYKISPLMKLISYAINMSVLERHDHPSNTNIKSEENPSNHFGRHCIIKNKKKTHVQYTHYMKSHGINLVITLPSRSIKNWPIGDWPRSFTAKLRLYRGFSSTSMFNVLLCPFSSFFFLVYEGHIYIVLETCLYYWFFIIFQMLCVYRSSYL